MCVRDLKSRGWERRGERVREVERVGGGRGRVRERVKDGRWERK